MLWAETKEGVFYTAEACSAAEGDTATSHAPIVPSELGFEAASRLLDQVIYISFTENFSFTITNFFYFRASRECGTFSWISVFIYGLISVFRFVVVFSTLCAFA